METKKITLRSQTVQCPHCGEYYSVTYKYCPFCDVGRQEEEKRLAEKKKKKQAFFGNLFGSAEPEKKKACPKSASQSAPGPGGRGRSPRPPGTPRQRAARQRAHPQRTWRGKNRQLRSVREKRPPPKSPPPAATAPGKKTSEMTEEEKAIALAEREARAAARKRERDRLAREAALGWPLRRLLFSLPSRQKRRPRWKSLQRGPLWWSPAPFLRRSPFLRPSGFPMPRW